MCNGRQLCLAEIPFEAAETISLMFQIQGWAVVASDDLPGLGSPPAINGVPPARLSMRAAGNIVEVVCADRQVAAQLAAAGLDRLVMPVSLPALEQLMVFAG